MKSLGLEEGQIFPAFSTVKKEENVFKLNKASSNEVRMTEFLLSCRKTIKKTFEYLEPEVRRSVPPPPTRLAYCPSSVAVSVELRAREVLAEVQEVPRDGESTRSMFDRLESVLPQ